MFDETREITNKNIVVKHRTYINGTIEVLFSGRGENIEEILAKTFQSPKSIYETVDFAKNLAYVLGCQVRFYDQSSTWIITSME